MLPARDYKERLKNKRVVVIKDGIVRGSSLSRSYRVIEQAGGHIAAFVILVDFDNPTPRADEILSSHITIEFLLGEDIGRILVEPSDTAATNEDK